MVYVDDGVIAAWRRAGARVVEWVDDGSAPFSEALERADPTLFLAMLQRSDRAPSSWTDPGCVAALRSRREDGLLVAVQSLPTDMPDFAPGLGEEIGVSFDSFPQAGVRSYYTLGRRPLPEERAAIDAGVIDVIRTPHAREAIPVLFRGFLDLGLPVHQELFAADPDRYPLDRPLAARGSRDVVVSFVGGCWPFKWHAMGGYIGAMRDAFGADFAVYGRGWPEGVSRGVLPDDASYVELIDRSEVVLSLHEPTQLTEAPFAINERPFKLAALGACVVSDPNPMLAGIFEPGVEMEFADSPDRMVSLIQALLGDDHRRASLGSAARTRVAAGHTYDHRVQDFLRRSAHRFDPEETARCSAGDTDVREAHDAA